MPARSRRLTIDHYELPGAVELAVLARIRVVPLFDRVHVVRWLSEAGVPPGSAAHWSDRSSLPSRVADRLLEREQKAERLARLPNGLWIQGRGSSRRRQPPRAAE